MSPGYPSVSKLSFPSMTEQSTLILIVFKFGLSQRSLLTQPEKIILPFSRISFMSISLLIKISNSRRDNIISNRIFALPHQSISSSPKCPTNHSNLTYFSFQIFVQNTLKPGEKNLIFDFAKSHNQIAANKFSLIEIYLRYA